MSEKSEISWTDATFNPWWGCTKVSPACDHCYAERDSKRFAPGKVLWGVGAEHRTFGDKHWNEPLRWARSMPAKLGRRPRVFCASMGDWLDLDAPLDDFVRLLELIRTTPALDWLLLTKRIGNFGKRVRAGLDRLIETEGSDSQLAQWIDTWLGTRPPANVWIGSTVIDQAEADRDIPKLLAVPARVRFLSIEPMLGPITLPPMRCDRGSLPGPGGVGGVTCPDCDGHGCLRLHWVIAGGESGPHARPSHPDWYRSLRDQCAAAGVPFHFKQWGEHTVGELQPNPAYPDDSDSAWRLDQRGQRWHDPMEGTKPREGWAPLKFLRVGKAAAGRQLDGVTHDGFPVL